MIRYTVYIGSHKFRVLAKDYDDAIKKAKDRNRAKYDTSTARPSIRTIRGWN